MGNNVFADMYELTRKISKYLPLSDGLDLDKLNVAIPEESVVQGEHWAIAGRTGTGKTTLVKSLVRAHRTRWPWLNVYYLDTKKRGDFTARDGPIVRSYEPPPPMKGIGKIQIWQPMEDNLDSYDQYFHNILEAGTPAVVVVDESKNLKFGQRIPRSFDLLLSQARLPGIHVITNMQEIAAAPRQALSQPSYVVSFSLWNTWDEMQMKRIMRIKEKGPLPLAGKYSLLLMRPDYDPAPRLFRNYRDMINAWYDM